MTDNGQPPPPLLLPQLTNNVAGTHLKLPWRLRTRACALLLLYVQPTLLLLVVSVCRSTDFSITRLISVCPSGTSSLPFPHQPRVIRSYVFSAIYYMPHLITLHWFIAVGLVQIQISLLGRKINISLRACACRVNVQILYNIGKSWYN